MDVHHIALAGAGLTGSYLAPHLARIHGIAQITIVDPDVYTQENLKAQNIAISDVGLPKVLVQAHKLAQVNPTLRVVSIQERIEDVPMGRLLRCDLMASCLDSRGARQHVNRIAWRLGIPWVDCAVLGNQSLTRVNTWMPANDAPCLECGWSDEDYSLIEHQYSCGAEDETSTHPTLASSALGALAASLLALEVEKLASGDPAVNKQIVLDAEHHCIQVTTGDRRNPTCRFDHRSWEIQLWPCNPDVTTVASALDTFESLEVEIHQFVTELVCPGPGCGRHENKGLRLNRPAARCAACGRRMVPLDFDAVDLGHVDLINGNASLTLTQIGLRTGDIVSSKGRHYEIQQIEETV